MFEILGGMFVLIIMVLMSGLKTVKEHTQLVVYRLGIARECKGPGLHLIIPLIENVELVETRIVSMLTPEVEAETRDGFAVLLKGECLYQVVDAKRAVTRVENIANAVNFVTQSALRELARSHELAELKSDTKRVNARLKSLIERQTNPWGIKINAAELTELKGIIILAPEQAEDSADDASKSKQATASESEADKPETSPYQDLLFGQTHDFYNPHNFYHQYEANPTEYHLAEDYLYQSNQSNAMEFSTPQPAIQEEAEVIAEREDTATPGQLLEAEPEPLAALSREAEAALSRERELLQT